MITAEDAVAHSSMLPTLFVLCCRAWTTGRSGAFWTGIHCGRVGHILLLSVYRFFGCLVHAYFGEASNRARSDYDNVGDMLGDDVDRAFRRLLHSAKLHRMQFADGRAFFLERRLLLQAHSKHGHSRTCCTCTSSRPTERAVDLGAASVIATTVGVGCCG